MVSHLCINVKGDVQALHISYFRTLTPCNSRIRPHLGFSPWLKSAKFRIFLLGLAVWIHISSALSKALANLPQVRFLSYCCAFATFIFWSDLISIKADLVLQC